MMFTTPDNIKSLCRIFISEGYEIRMVGGSVRDSLLGIKPKDIDLATNALPGQVIQLAERSRLSVIPTGLKHGTVTVIIDREPIEITTLRIDTNTDGRHAEVTFTNDWELDALRRDFTINAMSYDPMTGTLYDYFGGQKHLENKEVIFVGNAKERIAEDYLRVFRYFRFAGRMEARIPQEYANIFKEPWVLDGIRTISAERIWMEMKKIMSGNEDSILELFETGIMNLFGLYIVNRDYLYGTSNPLLRLSYIGCDGKPLSQKWKLSIEETMEYNFYRSRNWFDNPITIEEVKRSLFESKGDTFRTLIEVLNHTGDQETIDFVRTWNIPIFPLDGNYLMNHGFTEGPKLGKALKGLKEAWIGSDYQLTERELSEMVHKYR